MVRIIILFLIFNIGLLAQPFNQLVQPSTLTVQSKDLGTFTASETAGSDSIYLTLVGFMPNKIDSTKTAGGVVSDIYDSTLVYGDTLWNIFTYDKSIVGSFTDRLYVYHTGYGSPDTAWISYEILEFTTFIAETPIDFGTVYTSAVESAYVQNQSASTFTISAFNGLSTPFGLDEPLPISSVSAGQTVYYNVNFDPITTSLPSGTYTDTLIIVNSLGGVTYYDSVIVSAVYLEESYSPLAPANLAITDSTDTIILDWDDNAESLISYYTVQRSTDNINFTDLGTPSHLNSTYTDYVIDSVRYYYRVKAHNSLNYQSVWSDTVNAMMAIDGNNFYFVAESGSGSGVGSYHDPFATIAEVNAISFAKGDVVRFKSGDQFSDAILSCDDSVKYNTYGGTTKAIIGDSTGTAITEKTIDVTYQNVTLDNLKIYGYANSSHIIKMHANYLTITNCDIIGGLNAHGNSTIGISQQGVANTGTGHTILRNTIRDLGHAIYISQPYNTEIGYNEMYNLYLWNGRQDYGGYAIGMGAWGGGTSSTDFWDADYTYRVHHNNIYNFEYTAFAIAPSRMIVEYNEIHHSLDERIYRGGVKHGSIGKMYDFQGVEGMGSMGLIFRYNYVHDLVRRGEANYSYEQQTPERVKAETFVVASTNNGTGYAVYLYSAREGGAYWPHFGDQIDVNGDPIGEGPDCILSGLGYANYFVHNNIFYNCSNSINNRQFSYINGTTTEKPWRADLGSFFLNNTIADCGYLYYVTAPAGGLMYSEVKAQSPHTVVNNIIDYSLSNARFTNRWREDNIYVDHNIYTTQSGVEYTNWTGYPSAGDQVANVFDGSGLVVLEAGTNDQYLTDPNWVDTTSTVFLATIGTDGKSIPDFRITEGGNSYNQGRDYDSLGQTSLNAFGDAHTLGEDPDGRSFAYDIFGKLRTTNDIGAVGSKSSSIPDTTVGADSSYMITAYPSSYADDAHYYTSSMTTNTTTGHLVGNSGGISSSWLIRFNGINISSGATIDSAVIYLTAYDSRSATVCATIIVAEDTLSPVDYSTFMSNTSRFTNVTTASLNDTAVAYVSGTVYEYIVTDIVSELVASYTYADGSMSFFFKDDSSTLNATRKFKSYEGGTGYPYIKIWYTE